MQKLVKSGATSVEKEEVRDYLDQLESGTNKVVRTGRGFNQATRYSRANTNYKNEMARKNMKQIADAYKSNSVEDYRNLGEVSEAIRERALGQHITEQDKQLLELGQQAVQIKQQASPQEIVAKLEDTQRATSQALAQIAAMDNVADKEKAIDKCESTIKALAVIDAKANEGRMQEEIAVLIDQVATYKAEKLTSTGIKINENAIKELEQAMLAAIYEENSDSDNSND